jgi:hypothetical protein
MRYRNNDQRHGGQGGRDVAGVVPTLVGTHGPIQGGVADQPQGQRAQQRGEKGMRHAT